MDHFEHLLTSPHIDMLYAALPYVSDRMRKPLAVYIKSTEMQRILSDLDSGDILSACGYEPSSPDPEAMLKAMKLAGGPNAGPQIDQILQMMNMVKTYQKMNEMMQNNPELMSMLTNMMNQSQSQPANRSAAANPSDMMSFLTQMLKNN